MADLMNLLSGGLRGMGVSSIPGNFGLPPGFTPAPPQRPVGGFTPVPIEKLKALIMAEQAQKMNEAIIMKRAEEQMANEGFSRSNDTTGILANTSPEEHPVADAIKQGMSEEEFVKSIYDIEKTRRKPNEVVTPQGSDFVEGRIVKDPYGDNYLYVQKMIDPNVFKDNLKLEGMTYQQVVNMPTTQKYIEWYKSGRVPPPIDVVFNQPTGKLYSTDRRRVVAALEAGVKSIPANVELGKASTLYRQVKEKMGRNNQ